MVERQTSRRQQIIRGESYVGEATDMRDIQLPQQPGKYHGQKDHCSTTAESRHESTAINSHATSTCTSYISHDNELLLVTRSGKHDSRRLAKTRAPTGWRTGALISFLGALSIGVLNLVITISVWKSSNKESIGTLFEGNCGRVRKLNVWIHLPVNVLSTLLLCASNYCMQVLSAPNRDDLNRVHAQRMCLQIGVPSLKNLKHIGRDRKTLWIVLLLSSAPLHLLFNSVVFTNLQANKYAVIPTTEAWLGGGVYEVSNLLINVHAVRKVQAAMDAYRVNFDELVVLRDNSTMAKYKIMGTAECFNRYNSHHIPDVGTVYLVQRRPAVWRDSTIWQLMRDQKSKDFMWIQDYESPLQGYSNETSNFTLPFKSSPYDYPSNRWVCPSHATVCDVGNIFEVPQNRSHWEPYESPVDYCIVEQVEELCKLQFSFPIAAVVVSSSFVKAVCMLLTLLLYRRHAALATVGDALASFLDHPDSETLGLCLYSRQDIENRWAANDKVKMHKQMSIASPRRYTPRARAWASAATKARWTWTYTAYFVVLAIGIALFNPVIRNQPKGLRKLWQTGFDAVNGNNLMTIQLPLVGGVVLANTPQLLLSYLYLAFNALYTNMFVALESSSYAHERKPLRVTSPSGQQRDTYWLNVPYRYAIPLTVVSAIFHWLTAQSLFMVRITITDEGNRAQAGQISTCGYSPAAFILTIVMASLIAIYGVIIGHRRYPAGMPLASSCSAAISAACHTDEPGASLLPVQWGAVTHGERGRNGEKPVGHCSFSSLPVEFPIPGRFYA